MFIPAAAGVFEARVGTPFVPTRKLPPIILTRTSRKQKTYSREAAKNAKNNQGRFGFFRGFAASREYVFWFQLVRVRIKKLSNNYFPSGASRQH